MKRTLILAAATTLMFCAAMPLDARGSRGDVRHRPGFVENDGGFGVEFGYVHSDYYVKPNEDKAKTHPLNGFQVGINYDLPIIHKTLYFEPGLYYIYGNHSSSQNINLGLDKVRLTMSNTDHNLSIPLKFKYTYDFTRILKITADLGPNLIFGLSNNYKYTTKLADKSLSYTYHGYSGKVSSKNMTDEQKDIISKMTPATSYQFFDLSIAAGIGVELWDFLGFRLSYEYGCINRADSTTRDLYKVHRDMVNLSVSVRF